MIKIAILGDYNPKVPTLLQLDTVAKQLALESRDNLLFEWVNTDDFDFKTAFDHEYDGLWIAPGSPYRDANNVLEAIAHARINKIPTLGNCGGFQHMLIEFARNVCDLKSADHQETNQFAEEPVISKLSCSLVGETEIVNIHAVGSIMHKVYAAKSILAKYHCNYGFNQSYAKLFVENDLIFTAYSSDGAVRGFELKEHPFFVGTLFQPALTSERDHIDPLILSFVNASEQYRK
jgi:CTP synthase (UTP-ammonia lyase)